MDNSNEPIFIIASYIKPVFGAIYDFILRCLAFLWQCVAWVFQAIWAVLEFALSMLVEVPGLFLGLLEGIFSVLGSIFD